MVEHELESYPDYPFSISPLQARWPVWSALILYRQILPAIQANDYDNFTKRAYVPKWKKFASLPKAAVRAYFPVVKS